MKKNNGIIMIKIIKTLINYKQNKTKKQKKNETGEK